MMISLGNPGPSSFIIILISLSSLIKKIVFEANLAKVETFKWTFPDPWINKSIASWNSNELKIVSWIQDYNSKQILQVFKEVLE